ncbi:hypothetical protein AWW66_05195 [Micromonospora rosaria]|uniref:Uncharacterized protein n=1 Tax=Micromonospora rosaria TaxID=47874 RepID=A0A136PX42_9ACTN|nr:hypothetical protein [Micromonospora rosaria]KXK63041.1 hypothetical protein AWW66_05195 [Micromonospora rosaria]
MGISVYLALFAVAASATVFVVARRRLGLGRASALSALTFLGIAAASILFVQVALSGMDG